MARGRSPTLLLALALAFPAGQVLALPDRDAKAEREEDEQLLAKLIEIVEKTAAQAEDEELDKTPYGALDPKDRDVAAEMVRRLDNQRVSLNFDDTGFNDAIDFLRDVTGLNIILSRAAKDLVEGTSKLKLKLKDVKVRNALELILTQSDKTLRYGLRHGVLEIGTQEDWKGKNMILDVIPVGDLLYRPPDYPAPEAGLEMIKPKWKK